MNNKRAQALVNRNRHSFEEDFSILKNNLNSCLSMSDKPYINRSGQRTVYIEFAFVNGTRKMSIQQSPEVDELLNNFINGIGEFKKIEEPIALRNLPPQD